MNTRAGWAVDQSLAYHYLAYGQPGNEFIVKNDSEGNFVVYRMGGKDKEHAAYTQVENFKTLDKAMECVKKLENKKYDASKA